MMPRPSRSHCTAAPAMNALPSSAYVDLVADLPGDRREQPEAARRPVRAGVHEHERAGAVGALGVARVEARLAEERGLLVAGDARDRDAVGQARQRRASRRSTPRSATMLRQHGRGTRSSSHIVVVPAAACGGPSAACARRWSRRSRAAPAAAPPVSSPDEVASRRCRSELAASARARAPATWSSSHASLVPEK